MIYLNYIKRFLATALFILLLIFVYRQWMKYQLFDAIEKQNEEKIVKLIEKGAPVNVTKYGKYIPDEIVFLIILR